MCNRMRVLPDYDLLTCVAVCLLQCAKTRTVAADVAWSMCLTVSVCLSVCVCVFLLGHNCELYKNG